MKYNNRRNRDRRGQFTTTPKVETFQTNVQFRQLTPTMINIWIKSPKTGQFIEIDNAQIGSIDATLRIKLLMAWEIAGHDSFCILPVKLSIAELKELYRVSQIGEVK